MWVLGPERRFRALAAPIVGAGLFGLAALAERVLDGVLGLFALLAGLFIWRSPVRRDVTKKHVAAGGRGLSIDGALVVPRAAIAAGLFQPSTKGKPTVRVLDARGATLFEAHVDGERTARQLLAGLGVGVESQRVEMMGTSPMMASLASALRVLAVLSIALVAVLTGYIHAAAAAFPLLAALVAAAAAPTRLTVGADGVVVRWLRRERFVRASEIAGAKPNGGAGIVLELQTGERVVITMAAADTAIATRDRDATIARLQEMLRGQRRVVASPGPPLAALDENDEADGERLEESAR